jgi:hypothetical protein
MPVEAGPEDFLLSFARALMYFLQLASVTVAIRAGNSSGVMSCKAA